MTPKPGRASPLAPEDRREAIIRAVTPLLVEKGPTVTTRELAEAAGIAEGTIFSVFPDKHALVHEAVKHAMDPAPVVESLSGISEDFAFETQIAEAVRILTERFEGIFTLVSALRGMAPQERGARERPAYLSEANEAVNLSLTDLFARHRDRLRIEPDRAAAALRGLIFANGHPMLSPKQRLTAEEIVDVLLSGVSGSTGMAGA